MKKVFGKLASLCLTTTLLVGLMAGCGASGGKGSSAGEKTSGSEQATSAKLEGANPGGSDGQVLQLNQAMPTGDMGKISKVNDMEKYTQEDVEKVDRAIRAYTPSVSDGLLINNAEHFHYYESLTSPVKEFYEAMQMVAEDPVSADYYINVKLPNPITEEEKNNAVGFFYTVMNAFWSGTLSEQRGRIEAMPGYEPFFRCAEGYAYGWWLKELIRTASPLLKGFTLEIGNPAT